MLLFPAFKSWQQRNLAAVWLGSSLTFGWARHWHLFLSSGEFWGIEHASKLAGRSKGVCGERNHTAVKFLCCQKFNATFVQHFSYPAFLFIFPTEYAFPLYQVLVSFKFRPRINYKHWKQMYKIISEIQKAKCNYFKDIRQKFFITFCSLLMIPAPFYGASLDNSSYILHVYFKLYILFTAFLFASFFTTC